MAWSRLNNVVQHTLKIRYVRICYVPVEAQHVPHLAYTLELTVF